jgi:hypothetical protein
MEKAEVVVLIDELQHAHNVKSVRELAECLGMPATTLLTWYGGKISQIGELYLKDHRENMVYKSIIGDTAKMELEEVKELLCKLNVLLSGCKK